MHCTGCSFMLSLFGYFNICDCTLAHRVYFMELQLKGLFAIFQGGLIVVIFDRFWKFFSLTCKKLSWRVATTQTCWHSDTHIHACTLSHMHACTLLHMHACTLLHTHTHTSPILKQAHTLASHTRSSSFSPQFISHCLSIFPFLSFKSFSIYSLPSHSPLTRPICIWFILLLWTSHSVSLFSFILTPSMYDVTPTNTHTHAPMHTHTHTHIYTPKHTHPLFPYLKVWKEIFSRTRSISGTLNESEIMT